MNSTQYHPADLFITIACGIIGSVGAPANLFLLFIIASEYEKRKPHEWLLFNIALGDFILCLNNVAMEAPFILYPERIECKIAGGIDYLFGSFSFFTPPLIAYNRYLSLYNNQTYQRVFTNRNVFLAWWATLLFSFFWIGPFIISGSVGPDDMGLCGTQMRYTYLKVDMFILCIVIFGSYALLVYFSYKVIKKIKNHNEEATSAQFQSRLISESQEIITVMLIISAVPLFAQIPAAIVKLLNTVLPPFDPWVGRASIALFPTTSSVNAFVTIYIVKDYRKKALSWFRKASVRVAPLKHGNSSKNRGTEGQT